MRVLSIAWWHFSDLEIRLTQISRAPLVDMIEFLRKNTRIRHADYMPLIAREESDNVAY